MLQEEDVRWGGTIFQEKLRLWNTSDCCRREGTDEQFDKDETTVAVRIHRLSCGEDAKGGGWARWREKRHFSVASYRRNLWKMAIQSPWEFERGNRKKKLFFSARQTNHVENCGTGFLNLSELALQTNIERTLFLLLTDISRIQPKKYLDKRKYAHPISIFLLISSHTIYFSIICWYSAGLHIDCFHLPSLKVCETNTTQVHAVSPSSTCI